MKAIVYREFGGPEVLRPEDVEEPHPGPGQVRIAVRAAGVNPFDWKVRSGSFGSPQLPRTPGVDVAGVVDGLGEGVTGVEPGDGVFGWATGGAYAEHTVLGRFVLKPERMPWEVAAALPIAGDAARRGLDLLGVAGGDVLLVHGAAGSVGGIVVQLAGARGATVIGTASEAHHDHLRAIGAVPTTYGDGLVGRVRDFAPQGVDAIFDVAGRGALPASIELRGGADRIVTIADPAAERYGVPFSSGGGARSTAALDELVEHYNAGRLVAPVRRTFPLAEAAEAHRLGETGHGRGKIVLLVS